MLGERSASTLVQANYVGGKVGRVDETPQGHRQLTISQRNESLDLIHDKTKLRGQLQCVFIGIEHTLSGVMNTPVRLPIKDGMGKWSERVT
jgi:hypothetical protein